MESVSIAVYAGIRGLFLVFGRVSLEKITGSGLHLKDVVIHAGTPRIL